MGMPCKDRKTGTPGRDLMKIEMAKIAILQLVHRTMTP